MADSRDDQGVPSVLLSELSNAPHVEKTVFAHPYLALDGKSRSNLPNRWDAIAFLLLAGTLAAIALGARQFSEPLTALQHIGISLAPAALPEYALRTTLRMLAAMAVSLVFSLGYAYLAARSRRAERVLVPLLDILQSVPILGFLSFTVTFFLGLFPGKVIGAELAAIFVIFTSQAWNMTFSVYQSLRMVPADLAEACRSMRFSAWQRFRRLELPFAMPGLIWNMMMSMSGGWFFVVAAEAITVGNQEVMLPGIGSYVATAIQQQNLGAIGWAILAMLIVILLYDQLLFRPLIAWGDRFRMDDQPGPTQPESWMLRMLQRSRWISATEDISRDLRQRWFPPHPVATGARQRRSLPAWTPRALDGVWYSAIGIVAVYGGWVAVRYVGTALGWNEVLHVLLLGGATAVRVVVLVALASLVWVPIGVAIGLRPRVAAIAQPIAQFLAAFPANLLFPVAVVLIVHFHLSPDVWLSPLMILGTQWYILFNVVAGASVFPHDLRDAAANLHLRGWLWWKRAILPGILPYYVTGAMTAAGGCWNASIVAEFVDWGNTHLQAYGLGGYIQEATIAGDYPRIVLGVIVMSLFVVGFNRAVWRPLYRKAERQTGAGVDLG
ncbi:MAG: ABC transporter permease subunit [Nevskiaceae bacterium]|nr:MAG: ABC transporter permease subunit [Nevskiaceae bacterium]TBR71874.1 MAG: ABC transporter permease subunit [Nevskiaceae bacterium]